MTRAHGHGHGHGHRHPAPAAPGGAGGTAAARQRGRLAAVLVLTLAVLVVEVVGGWLSGSLALLADAGHVGTDAAGLGLSLLAATYASRPATAERTFGYLRLEILASVANAVLLLAVAGYVLVEAARRVLDPPAVDSGAMLGFAVVGLVANAVGLLLLRPGAAASLNVRGAYLEVLADLLGSAAVIVAALVIAATGWRRADPLASMLIGVTILPRTWALLREAVDVLLEATPRGVDLADVRRHILDLPDVLDVHDLHAWTITSGLPVLSAHVVVREESMAAGCGPAVLDRLGACLSGHFDIAHSTFQLEPAGHADHEGAAYH